MTGERRRSPHRPVGHKRPPRTGNPHDTARCATQVHVHERAQKQPAITGTMRGTMSWNGKRWVVADLALDKPAAG